jgi:signal transduction histidine kinase
VNPYSLPPLITAVVSLTLRLFVLLKNSRSPINFSFFLLCFSTFWWQFAWVILFNLTDPRLALTVCKVGYTGIIFIPIAYYHFITEFTESRDNFILAFSYLVGAALIVIIWTTDLFVSGYHKYFWGYYPQAGILHSVHLLQILFSGAVVFYVLFREAAKTKLVSPIRYNQIKYAIMAAAFYVPAATDYMVNYGVVFYPFGFIFVICALGLYSYAIIKYHFMDINIVITKSVTLLAVSLAAAVIGFIVMFYYDKFIMRAHTLDFLWPHLLIAMVLVGGAIYLYPRIFPQTQERVKRMLFKGRYDYQKTMLDSLRNRNVLAIHEVRQLLEYMLAVVKNSLGARKAAVLMFDSAGKSRVELQYGYADADLSAIHVSRDLQALALMDSLHRPLAKSEMAIYLSEDELDEFVSALQPVDVQVVLPLIAGGELTGMMCLDNKTTGDIYSKEDLELLDIMFNQLSIAVDKINLSDELIEKERLAFIGSIAESLAHEINNPLASIDMFVKMAPEKCTDPAFMASFQEIVPAALKRIIDISQDMLSFSKAGDLAISRFNVGHLVEHVVELLTEKIRAAQVKVQTDCEDIREFPGDVNQLTQVLLNLVLNAIQASKEGGVILISARLQPDLSGPGMWLRLSVKDEGEGINRRDRDRIFKPFHSTKIYGTGLGLSISRRIVEAHGGRLEVESEAGKGCRVTVVLPEDAAPANGSGRV